jgi:hypothetical protein
MGWLLQQVQRFAESRYQFKFAPVPRSSANKIDPALASE